MTYDVIMTSLISIQEDSKRSHQDFLLCNNNEISNYCMHCRFIQHFLWRSVCGCRWSGKFNYTFVDR